jgi:adenylate cyclase
VPEPDVKAYTDTDVEQAKRLKVIFDVGVPVQGLVEANRVLGRAMAQVAAAMRQMVADAFVTAGDREDEAARQLLGAARGLMPTVGPALEYAFGQHLLEVLRRDVIGTRELESGSMGAAREMSVAFADLVGFTRLGEEVDPEDLGHVVGRLEQLAADVVRPPVTLVKTIGDALMLVSPVPEPLVTTALDLIAAADAEGDEFPQLRVGIACGPVLERAGDWYGRPVNLASRLTGRAWPGSVLTTELVREHAGDDGLRWSRTGSKKLRGVPEPVPVWRARRADR